MTASAPVAARKPATDPQTLRVTCDTQARSATPITRSPRPSPPGWDVTPVTGPLEGVEVDLVHPTGAWSVRLTRDRRTGAVSLIVVDHAQGCPVVAQVLRQPEVV